VDVNIGIALQKVARAIKPEEILIHLKMNYTSLMEKAMMSAHGVCYELYSRRHDVRMQVEKRRDLDYLASQRISADLDRKLHI
jgi:hypothetical protein